jgi:DNA-binding response OmpR family regulator
LARVRALTKRINQTKHLPHIRILHVSDLKLDLDTKIAHRGGKSIMLTAKEFDLLEYFMSNAGRVISKSELAEKVWDITFDTGTNVVEVYINILRKKIDKDFTPKLLHTRIGLGYILSSEQ